MSTVSKTCLIGVWHKHISILTTTCFGVNKLVYVQPFPVLVGAPSFQIKHSLTIIIMQIQINNRDNKCMHNKKYVKIPRWYDMFYGILINLIWIKYMVSFVISQCINPDRNLNLCQELLGLFMFNRLVSD